MDELSGTVELFALNVEGFGNIIISAVRYALGRQTYIVKDTASFVKFLLPKLSNRTLMVLERDVREAIAHGNYGDYNIDKPVWDAFLLDVQKEIFKRSGEDGQSE